MLSEVRKKIEVLANNEIFSDHEETMLIKSSVDAFFSNLGSDLTKKSYKSSCTEFSIFVSQKITNLNELTRNHIIEYQAELKARGLAKKTILRKVAAVSSLCKYLAHEGFLDKDMTYGINRPKSENNKETGDFTDEQVKLLFKALDRKSPSYTSQRALLAVGFYAGLRSAEIRHLQLGNLGVEKEHRIIRLTIKGDKKHEVPLTPFAYRCIQEHINHLKSLGLNVEDTSQWIFPCLRPLANKPISARGFERTFKRILTRCEIKQDSFKRYTPHSMRATLAGHLLNTIKAPLEQVQRTLGHSSPTTTMAYNKRKTNHDESPLYKIGY